jgi:hypothetical protein
VFTLHRIRAPKTVHGFAERTTLIGVLHLSASVTHTVALTNLGRSVVVNHNTGNDGFHNRGGPCQARYHGMADVPSEERQDDDHSAALAVRRGLNLLPRQLRRNAGA